MKKILLFLFISTICTHLQAQKAAIELLILKLKEIVVERSFNNKCYIDLFEKII